MMSEIGSLKKMGWRTRICLSVLKFLKIDFPFHGTAVWSSLRCVAARAEEVHRPDLLAASRLGHVSRREISGLCGCVKWIMHMGSDSVNKIWIVGIELLNKIWDW